ncbi:nodulation protein NfeD [bacterium]|nr:nodulation protein NfeD [bacterium]
MKRKILYIFLMLFGCLAFSQQPIYLLKIEGAITPSVSRYTIRVINEAVANRAQAVIIEMDTPGGLDKSMREIIQKELSAPIPVIVFVYPPGARAASAGAYITIAADIAAMAPGTNIGAATPVQLGGMPEGEGSGTMERKIVNDAAAFMKSLAQKKHRNVQWAEEAVRKARSSSAEEALKLGVIDLIANDLQDLLNKLDGKEINKDGVTYVLHTKGAPVSQQEMNWREKFLQLLSDPNFSYLLLLLATYGIIFELSNPGAILPGVIGAMALILALYSFAVLPVNWAGLALMGLGIGFLIAEVKAPTHGLLGIAGGISFLIGSIMLFEDVKYQKISLSLIVSMTVFTILFFLFVITAGIKAQFRAKAVGKEALVGKVAEVRSDLNPTGIVFVEGELWKAESISGPIEKGSKVRIVAMKGLTLQVEKEKEV